ncbi:MAG: hypothetical protein KDI36_19865 [Pseudomonadales bacterium]|nr:hypothetical protein [Pseudomonadales bacterium]
MNMTLHLRHIATVTGGLLLTLSATLWAASATEAPAPASTDNSDNTATQQTGSTAEPAQALPPDDKQTQAVIDMLETFVPSEEIDIDKAVDFPTNI